MLLGTGMDSGHGRMRISVQCDRLSSLPDELVHKILSSFDIKQVIETSSLSSRWRYIWTSMPYLNFSSKTFSRLTKFAKFVTHVLSRRNNHAEVYSLNIYYLGKMTPAFVKRILNYAFSHKIQQLNVECESSNSIGYPLSRMTSQSLKQLSLAKPRGGCCSHVTSTWELPSLTTLDLEFVNLNDDNDDKCINVFSKCANLKNLTITNFNTEGSNGFSIVHPRLSNLTLKNYSGREAVNVAAPQLKNLTIRRCYPGFVISAPELVSLVYEVSDQLNLSSEGFHSLEMADIRVTDPEYANAHQIVSTLQVLHNVNILTLNVRVVEFLSSSVGPLLHQLSSFVNLKSLKIYPDESYMWLNEMWRESMSTELKSYLLDISPGCPFPIVLPEEIKAKRLMAKLRELLVKEKDNTRQEKASAKDYKSNTEMTARFEGCWENLVVQIEQSKKNARHIISELQRIEKLLAKLPASRRDEILPCFSSLCAEASNTISRITDCIMISCEESQSRSNVLLHELAAGCVTTRFSSVLLRERATRCITTHLSNLEL